MHSDDNNSDRKIIHVRISEILHVNLIYSNENFKLNLN